MHSLNKFNTEFSAIFEPIKEFHKYSNDFFGIELKKSAPVGIINHCAEQIEYLNKITENLDDNTEIITEITEEALEEFDDEFDEDMKGEVEV